MENAEVSAETEVRKPKYGSEKKSRLSVFSALLCVLRPCSQKGDSIPAM